jgi:hypothetical protein
MQTVNAVAIYDFHDSRSTGSVKVTVQGKPITLSPGIQVVLTPNAKAKFDSVNPGRGFIGYRNIRLAECGAGVKAYICDFAIPHGVTNNPYLHNMLTSNDAQQKKLAHSILKNAAILADLTGFDYKTSEASE